MDMDMGVSDCCKLMPALPASQIPPRPSTYSAKAARVGKVSSQPAEEVRLVVTRVSRVTRVTFWCVASVVAVASRQATPAAVQLSAVAMPTHVARPMLVSRAQRKPQRLAHFSRHARRSDREAADRRL